jgi:hypothetical protein
MRSASTPRLAMAMDSLPWAARAVLKGATLHRSKVVISASFEIIVADRFALVGLQDRTDRNLLSPVLGPEMDAAGWIGASGERTGYGVGPADDSSGSTSCPSSEHSAQLAS